MTLFRKIFFKKIEPEKALLFQSSCLPLKLFKRRHELSSDLRPDDSVI